jgi:hypothetical protein
MATNNPALLTVIAYTVEINIVSIIVGLDQVIPSDDVEYIGYVTGLPRVPIAKNKL